MQDCNVDSKRIVVFDCQVAGVSGDMFLGALLDLGADPKKIESVATLLEDPMFGYANIKMTLEKVMRKGFKATRVDIAAQAAATKNEEKLIEIVERLAKKLNLSDKGRTFASKVIHTLVNVEVSLHNSSLEHAHLHEVGMIDTAFEIVGCAVALDDLGLFDADFYSTPVAVGGGVVKFSHGIVPSPAPATLAILQSKSFPLVGGPVEFELTTPTGAAILVNLVEKVSCFYPAMIPLKLGYGSGCRDFSEIPNVLRVTVGAPLKSTTATNEIAVLETNLDDVSGEIIGFTMDKLLGEGAKDVSVIPVFAKKNRPGHIIKVISDPKDVDHLSNVLIRETGTLGVRVYLCGRHVVNRETLLLEIPVHGASRCVRVKVSKSISGEILNVKPEFEDIKTLAHDLNKSFRETSDLVLIKAKEILREK